MNAPRSSAAVAAAEAKEKSERALAEVLRVEGTLSEQISELKRVVAEGFAGLKQDQKDRDERDGVWRQDLEKKISDLTVANAERRGAERNMKWMIGAFFAAASIVVGVIAEIFRLLTHH